MSYLISNSYIHESSHLLSPYDAYYEPSMLSRTIIPIPYDYQYNSSSVSMFDYYQTPKDDYYCKLSSSNFETFINIDYFLVGSDYTSHQPSSTFIDLPEPKTVKILINPFFRPKSTNRTSESSSEIEQHKQNTTKSARDRTRSPPSSDRKVIVCSNKIQHGREKRKGKKEQFMEEKKLLFEKQSSSPSSSKRKHYRSTSDRCEHKNDKLKRLYKQYSDEDQYTKWKPLLLEECSALYKYANDKYHRKSFHN
ncbi:unnamed protein product [Rotaria magnacalcarata]|uniref:Uncharacterized protein n=1 Tax=Rotaria magnacalcarata TaxID=392030 RepID=A0A8S2U7W8_9BILA|nr:unnamed protein product [Rotaria magnacalcarata]CAF5164666.1 unnamed protein product [Rotaria magnacalcarata]